MESHHHGADAPGLFAPELARQDRVDLARLGTTAAHAVVPSANEKAADAAIIGDPVQTETKHLTFEQLADDNKQFSTLQAHLALKGYSLSRTDPSDGPVSFYTGRFGMARHFCDLAGVARFLNQLGGSMSEPVDDFRVAILAALGHAPEVIEPGQIHRFSTSGRPSDKAGWCQLFKDGRAGVFGDFRRGMSSVWTARRRELMRPAERADMTRRLAQNRAQREAWQRQQWGGNSLRNAALWSQTAPVTGGDPVSLYLQRRGLAGPIPECLRLHPQLTYWDGGDQGTYPAMIAPLIRPDGLLLALHRTYLTPVGCKAPVLTVKKLTGAAGPLAGAFIPLHKPQQGVIGVAEGIETAQAAHLASGLPTVAAYCASNLANFIWPVDTRRLVVFADADQAGAAAAQSLKARAINAGLRVTVMTPTTPGADWCDVWSQRTAVTVIASEAGA